MFGSILFCLSPFKLGGPAFDYWDARLVPASVASDN
jgi:hypothetical protein|tara:strand:- start:501 stop:608 length:108 start_codon:yes stop_codon:yes gene_type:complete